MIRLLRLLSLFTDADFYCGLSALYENDAVAGPVLRELELLTRTGNLAAFSHELSRDEFLESRRNAYEYDAARYPNYFSTNDSVPLFAPTRLKPLGSTAPLHRELLIWADELPRTSGKWQPVALGLADPVGSALRKREGQAITFSYFRPELGALAQKASVEYRVRRKISEAFTRDYMQVGNGDIATGISGLQFFDSLSISFPAYDIPVLGHLAYILGCSDLVNPQTTPFAAFEPLVLQRREIQFYSAGVGVRWLIDGLSRWVAKFLSPTGGIESIPSQDVKRARLRAILQDAARATGVMSLATPWHPDVVGAHMNDAVARLARSLGDRHADLRTIFEESPWGQSVEQIDVLLVTVNDAETNALDVALQEAGFRDRTVFYTNNSYHIYAGVAGTVVAAVRSGMSSRGTGGSTLTVREAIDDLRPAYVIAVGVAFGMKESQAIGQVLISRQLADYELQRMGTNEGNPHVVDRGSRVDAHPRILGRFLAASLGGHGFDVQVGQVISGDKLIDNLGFRQALAERFPEAIGGEMEGAGIQAAADREGTQWLVVKSVCDYAFGKSSDKMKRQAIAADSAARAVVHVICQGGLRKGL
ncbi:hypothetical protein OHB24_10840 [Kribbella sp. NBC_00482]|uniref:5'-methylthioadenosine/S-adenosylhomocysteine nucleosidase family protein n=1 Tax=Kribbella sp. NBC_00482 TaxID=2975968 RepID=UPI002E197B7E